MVTAPEDPIEAIKKRNEERAQKLKEKIASGEFFGFGEAIDEIAETPAEPALETTSSEFDLSSFPPPPETGTIPIGEEATVAAPLPADAVTEPSVPDGLDIEITPLPTEPEPAHAITEAEESVGGLEIEVTPHVEQPSVSELLTDEPEPVAVEAPPPPPEEMVAATLPTDDSVESVDMPSVEIAGISFDGDDYGDFPVPETWEGEEGLAVEPEPTTDISEPDLVEEPAAVADEAIPEVVVETEPITEITEPVEEPIIAAAEPIPEVAVEPEPIIAPEIDTGQLTISVNIEIQGNNVRVRRENIDMDGTIELFKRIIDKYDGK